MAGPGPLLNDYWTMTHEESERRCQAALTEFNALCCLPHLSIEALHGLERDPWRQDFRFQCKMCNAWCSDWSRVYEHVCSKSHRRRLGWRLQEYTPTLPKVPQISRTEPVMAARAACYPGACPDQALRASAPFPADDADAEDFGIPPPPPDDDPSERIPAREADLARSSGTISGPARSSGTIGAALPDPAGTGKPAVIGPWCYWAPSPDEVPRSSQLYEF